MISAIQEPASLYSPANVRPLKVALYARVSTVNKKKEKPQDPETQLFRLRRYAAEQGYEIFKEYSDRASGADPSRPALDLMIADAKDRRFSLILVCKIDRIARSVINLCSLLEELELYGVKFSCVDQPEVSTKGPMGRLLLHILAAVAEFERELIRDRTMAGLERARAEGKTFGRPRVEVDATKVLELLSEGKSYEDIAEELKVSVGTAHSRSKKEGAESSRENAPRRHLQ
jgi:DNA invertase Pin-like site-specific DNA recombinase